MRDDCKSEASMDTLRIRVMKDVPCELVEEGASGKRTSKRIMVLPRSFLYTSQEELTNSAYH
jgi:hypothetical protein